MKCQDARRLLSPYLDSELSGQEAFGVSRHLEQCVACARRFEAEERLEHAIVEAIAPRSECPGDYIAAIQGGTLRPRRRQAVRLMVIAALLIAVGGLITLLLRTRDQPATLAASLLRMHHEVLSGTELPHATVRDLAGAERFFADRNVPVRFPPWLDVRGVRLCALGGEPLALLFARDGGREVSVFAGSERLLRPFDQERQRLVDGARIVEESGPARVVVSLCDDVVVAAAGCVEDALLQRIVEESR